MAEAGTGSNAQVTWLRGGAALSLGFLAWALWRKRWRAARLGFRAAAACLEKSGELRLRARVLNLLARAEYPQTPEAAPFTPPTRRAT